MRRFTPCGPSAAQTRWFACRRTSSRRRWRCAVPTPRAIRISRWRFWRARSPTASSNARCPAIRWWARRTNSPSATGANAASARFRNRCGKRSWNSTAIPSCAPRSAITSITHSAMQSSRSTNATAAPSIRGNTARICAFTDSTLGRPRRGAEGAETKGPSLSRGDELAVTRYVKARAIRLRDCLLQIGTEERIGKRCVPFAFLRAVAGNRDEADVGARFFRAFEERRRIRGYRVAIDDDHVRIFDAQPFERGSQRLVATRGMAVRAKFVHDVRAEVLVGGHHDDAQNAAHAVAHARQNDGEGAALVEFALHLNIAAVTLDERLREIQA